jgi:peptidoglycan hydrolase CwlO-like protein
MSALTNGKRTQAARVTLEANASSIIKLETLTKEYKITGEKMQKEINKLTTKKTNLQTDLDNTTAELEKVEKEMHEQEKHTMRVRYELKR